MSKRSIDVQYHKAAKVSQIVSQIQKDKNHFQVSNLVGSSLSFVVGEAFKKAKKPFLLIFNDKEEATYYLNDLEQLIGDKNVLFFPSSYRGSYTVGKTNMSDVLLRSEALKRINYDKKPLIIVTYDSVLLEKVISKNELDKNVLEVSVNENISLEFLNEVLFEYKFKRVNFVTEPGDFSVRGGIIDVFSFSNNEPYRIEFFGDEIESIRTFDVETQLSINKLKKITITPNIEDKTFEESRECFLDYISSKTFIFIKNIDLTIDRLSDIYKNTIEDYKHSSDEIDNLEFSKLFCNGNYIKNKLENFTLAIQDDSNIKITDRIIFNIKEQPSFNKQFNLLIDNLIENHKKGFSNYILCSNEQQANRFRDIFEDAYQEISCQVIVFPLYKGFIDADQKTACYTDHQIFQRYHKFRLKNGYSKKQSVTLKELNKLEIGDYITHLDHGIGKFGGLQEIDVQGKKQEAIKLIYGDRDVLYVNIHSLHKVSKYSGKDGKTPKIYKLGSGAWKKIKHKTKAKVKDIAFNLIQLYAKRKLEKGFAFKPDTHIQHELESSFIYEDTPDQFIATKEVKNDMEKDQNMDRLVCGDVGFGKTEIAIRAAFKAVDNGKQVAVLVSTTILAFQHFKTFSERLKQFPVAIDYVNRFRTNRQRNEIIKEVNIGKIDIIIGTHQLTNKRFTFKDLGLLIIDEEQKFGVAIKDKLKTLKENIDTLTLTATPIPRTLQFSLMAARDLSVIKTPPPNRHPIKSSVIRFSEETIKEAVSYEIYRGGQVFFIHNRVENIKEISGMLKRLVPEARITFVHGQMEGKILEETMLNFMNNKFDILVSTTIIENGLDVPNANTIFINNAQNFGLSDLHQMRGRVGRSNKKAFCYFITPEFHSLTDIARKRIQSVELFSELGSGINIAMKDLEIRGAGDLLGGEQSGFINEIGFDTYHKILKEAIEELKENEFKELYTEQNSKPREFVKSVQLDTDFEILFSSDYINSVAERFDLYNKLSTLKTEDELKTFESEIIDRFGKIPDKAKDLFNSMRIKWLAKELGFEKIILKQKRMIGFFVSDQNSDYYKTEVFGRILNYAKENQKTCVIKEKEKNNKKRLLITFIHINSVKTALNVLDSLVFSD